MHIRGCSIDAALTSSRSIDKHQTDEETRPHPITHMWKLSTGILQGGLKQGCARLGFFQRGCL